MEQEASPIARFHDTHVRRERIARRDSRQCGILLGDQLGSRARTNATGGILDDIDYCPYGSECYVASQTSGNNYKFTGKERDAESGLDYFTRAL